MDGPRSLRHVACRFLATPVQPFGRDVHGLLHPLVRIVTIGDRGLLFGRFSLPAGHGAIHAGCGLYGEHDYYMWGGRDYDYFRGHYFGHYGDGNFGNGHFGNDHFGRNHFGNDYLEHCHHDFGELGAFAPIASVFQHHPARPVGSDCGHGRNCSRSRLQLGEIEGDTSVELSTG